MPQIVLKAVCAFSKWFKYEGLPFMVVFENYQLWRTRYAGHGISHIMAYNILRHLINTYEKLSKYRMKMYVKEYKPQVVCDFRGQDYVQLKTVKGYVNNKRNFPVWRG